METLFEAIGEVLFELLGTIIVAAVRVSVRAIVWLVCKLAHALALVFARGRRYLRAPAEQTLEQVSRK